MDLQVRRFCQKNKAGIIETTMTYIEHEDRDAIMHDPAVRDHQTHFHHKPKTFSDKIAYGMVHIAARTADLFFVKRYGHRAVVLETVAAIPGMVGGLLQHLKSLRRIRDDHGWIKTLVDEAENERIHLMVYVHIAKPTLPERFLIMVVQFIIYHLYFIVYLISPRTGHRFVGYLEEEAVHSYSCYLEQLEAEPHKNIPAPAIAIRYWQLPPDARMKEVVLATREDEMRHRDVNHSFADKLTSN